MGAEGWHFLYAAHQEPPVPQLCLSTMGVGGRPLKHLCVERHLAPSYKEVCSALFSCNV